MKARQPRVMDQARTLRRLAGAARQGVSAHHTLSTAAAWEAHKNVRVLAFTSAKGGVGKTHIVVNLACALQRMGARVMILDADLGLANVDVLLGLTPHYNIQHVFEGRKTLDDILVEGPDGMVILPASSGVQNLVNLTEERRLQLLAAFDAMETEIDFLLVDTGPGISANVMYFNMAAQEIIVVVTPEPTSITDAYALMKVLYTRYAEKNFKVIMNAVVNGAEAKEAFRRLSTVAERYLNISIDYLGFIPYDDAFPQAVRQQRALLELYPRSAASRCFRNLAQQVQRAPTAVHSKGNIQFFWKQFLARYSQSSFDMSGR